MASKKISLDGRLLQRNVVPPALACLGSIVVLAIALHPDTDLLIRLMAVPGGLLLAALCLATAANNSFPLGRPCRVDASQGELHISGLPPIGRDAIRGITTQMIRRGAARLNHVTIVLEQRNLWLELQDAEVEPLLEALALRPEHRRAGYPIGSGLRTRIVVVGVLALPVLLFTKLPLVVFVLLVVVVAWFAGNLRGRAEVGIDGASVRWARLRFVPFGEVASIDCAGGWHGPTTQLHLRSGSTLRLRTPAPISNAHAQRELGYRMCEHLTLAFESFGGKSEDPALFAALMRGEQSGKQWLETARTAALGAGYRAAAIGLDRMEQVLVAPESPAESRIAAAAVMLRISEEGRARVQVAATSCASPLVRQTLETLLATEDEAELASALERFEAPPLR